MFCSAILEDYPLVLRAVLKCCLWTPVSFERLSPRVQINRSAMFVDDDDVDDDIKSYFGSLHGCVQRKPRTFSKASAVHWDAKKKNKGMKDSKNELASLFEGSKSAILIAARRKKKRDSYKSRIRQMENKRIKAIRELYIVYCIHRVERF